jgi:hypothetical protein
MKYVGSPLNVWTRKQVREGLNSARSLSKQLQLPCLINQKRLESSSTTAISELVMDTLHANI